MMPNGWPRELPGQVSPDPVGVPGPVEPGQRMDLLQPGRIPTAHRPGPARHEDRLRADLALLLLKVNAGIDEGDVPREGQ